MSQVLDFVPIWTLILGMAVFLYVPDIEQKSIRTVRMDVR